MRSGAAGDRLVVQTGRPGPGEGGAPGPLGPEPGDSGVALGALALALAGLGAKVLSAVSRVVVARWLGAEAVGLVEMAAPVLATGISLAGLGLPVAAAARIAAAWGRGDRLAVGRLLAATRWVLLAAGLGVGLGVALSARPLARLLGNPGAAGPLWAVAPGILLAGLLAGEKAWLQASGRVVASAAPVIGEQVARVGAACAAAAAFAGVGPARAPLAATWVALSPALGAAVGLATCLAVDRRVPAPRGGLRRAAGGRPSADARRPVRALLAGGLPNWVSSAVGSLTMAVDVPLLTWRLRAAGMAADDATAALGELNGMALPLGTGPAVLFGAVASALIPAAASDWARGQRDLLRRRGEAAYFWVLALALPCAVLLWQLAEPLSVLLYRDPDAAVPLAVLAWSGLPLALTYVAAALANAVGRPSAVLPGACAGAALKSLLVLALTGWAGVRGAAWGSTAGFVLSALLNVHAVAGLVGCRPPWVGCAAVAAPAVVLQLLAAELAWGAAAGMPTPLRVLAAAAAGGVAYAAGFLAAWRGLGARLGLPHQLPLRWAGLRARPVRHAQG
jgi:stage V sporulation protein B